MILEQNQIDRNAFIMHHAISERDPYEDWQENLLKWKCSGICWIVIGTIILIILGLIFIISLSAGIAAR